MKKIIGAFILSIVLWLPVNAFALYDISFALSLGTGLQVEDGEKDRSALNLEFTPGFTLLDILRLEVGLKMDMEAREFAVAAASAKSVTEGDAATKDYRLFAIEPGVRVFPYGGFFARAAVGPEFSMSGPDGFKTQFRLIGGLGYELTLLDLFGVFVEGDVSKTLGGADKDALGTAIAQPQPLYLEGRIGAIVIF